MTNESKLKAGTALADAKLRLLTRLRNQTTRTVTDTGGANEIIPRPRGIAAPLSFAQERLWFLQQCEPASSVYNVARAWRLKGALDIARFGRCMSIILERY